MSKRKAGDGGEGMEDIKLTKEERTFYGKLQSRNMMAKSQDEVYSFVPETRDRDWLKKVLNKFMNFGLVILKQDSTEQLSYQPVAPGDAKKLRQIENDDERMVYTQVRDAGTSGVWSRTLRQKTLLHTTVINRSLKNLEALSLIKQFRHVQYSTRKYYILYDLQPSIEVSGGTFFTDSELDTGFVNGVRRALLHTIEKSTYPNMADKSVLAVPGVSSRDKAPTTVGRLTKILNAGGAFAVKLEEADTRLLLNTLVSDGKVQLLGDNTYRAVHAIPEDLPYERNADGDIIGDLEGESMAKSTRPALMDMPCGECPVFHLCEPGGVVSPEGCDYWSAWLEKNM